ncbi:PA2169 family four-helix-bundle protein [Flavivirga sp. 57AJ16]|uniref:ferritin-like domain-containing protein n=1 Tax=Flavivirga sp. 57AJ16 TaxID=3025307 RepID=UPI0023666B8B|nr:PA2169 family four-helix-bundle protein [Flavivirga sp. 57AJ16]MDD7886614.1 PA2169 family four-helix-bundle protein [Flavivirga sp. 57AJ16]
MESINKETLKINKETVEVLQELLQKNYDAETGYKKVMTKANSLALKDWLQSKARQRNTFATQLDSQIRELNATPATSGSVLGSVHRTWIDIKTALSSDTDEAILEECIRGEKASVKEYEAQLEKNEVYSYIGDLLKSQLTDIKNALNTVKRLEDIVS